MHDRGLTNFESGTVDNKPPKYHPLRVDPIPDPDQLLEFALLMRLNPTLNIRGLDGESTINLGGNDRSSSEGGTEEAEGNEGSTTDLQSTGIASTSERLQEEVREGNHKRENSDAYTLAEHIL